MSELISGNDWLCWDGYDVSGVTNDAKFQWTQDTKDVLCYKPPTSSDSDSLNRKRFVGAEDWTMSISGYLDFAVNYAVANSSLAANDLVVTRGFSRTAGSRCLLLQAALGKFEFGGPVGDVVPLAADLSASSSIVVPGVLFEFSLKTATFTGTSQTIGAALSSQSTYLHAHAVAVTGTPSFVLVYETSAIGDYSDAVTRHTFTAFTAIGRQRAVLAGPNTDTHGRFRGTLTGTGTILFRLAAGIR